MRIPISDSEYLGADRSVLNAIINVSGVKFPTTFLLDTGCPLTIISEMDLKRTRVPYSKCALYPKPLIIANIDMRLRDLGECEMTFLDVEGNPIQLKHQLYAGIFPTNLTLSTAFPSFLGKDFIEKFNLAYSKRDDKGIRYLE